MNPKKLLQILEICCPIFTKAEGKNGEPDTTTPLGYAIWFFARVAGVWKAIWSKDNDVIIIADKFINFCLALAFSVAILPLVLGLWILGNLIFSIRYDNRHGRQSHLFLMYSFVLILFIALGILFVDYNNNGAVQESINGCISQSVDQINEMNPRENVRKPFVAETVTEVPAVTEPEVVTEPEITTAETISEPVEYEEGYVLQRISR